MTARKEPGRCSFETPAPFKHVWRRIYALQINLPDSLPKNPITVRDEIVVYIIRNLLFP